mmetsp:Transcript_36489/g.93246  ORF Transcript_36489/g.93246 Transcript_36489/m.93246 type:complete len:263 (+) Transcript_36489:376-1164(+)
MACHPAHQQPCAAAQAAAVLLAGVLAEQPVSHGLVVQLPSTRNHAGVAPELLHPGLKHLPGQGVRERQSHGGKQLLRAQRLRRCEDDLKDGLQLPKLLGGELVLEAPLVQRAKPLGEALLPMEVGVLVLLNAGERKRQPSETRHGTLQEALLQHIFAQLRLCQRLGETRLQGRAPQQPRVQESVKVVLNVAVVPLILRINHHLADGFQLEVHILVPARGAHEPQPRQPALAQPVVQTLRQLQHAVLRLGARCLVQRVDYNDG